jgi:hypothetical protein
MLDPPELLDVDVDQLARALALVASRRQQAYPSEFAHPDPGEDPRHGRYGQAEHFGDLRTGEPQPPQRGDRMDPLPAGAVRDRPRR